MFGLNDEDSATRSQPLVDGFGDLGGQTLLELGSAGVRLHHPGQLGQPNDLPVWYVAYVGLADERHEVMFAERMQGYVSHEDHLAMFFLEPHVQVPGGVIGQPGEEERVGLGDAPWRTSEAFPLRVLAYGDQYLPNGPLYPGPIYPVS